MVNDAQTKATVLGREPVMFLAIVQAGLALALGFGLPVTPEQIGLILAFAAAVLGFIARSQVTPMETLPSGETIVNVEVPDREALVTEALDRLEQAGRGDDVDAVLRRR